MKCVYCSCTENLFDISDKICPNCTDFKNIIICKNCLDKDFITNIFPCILRKKLIYRNRIISNKHFFKLENPSFMDNPCYICEEPNGVYRFIDIFCDSCYERREKCYICDICFSFYSNKYNFCAICSDLYKK